MREKYLSIRLRMMLKFILSLAIIFPLIYFGFSRQILSSYGEIEKLTVSEKMNAVANVVDNMAESIRTTAVDWSERDDTYQFINDLNEEYIVRNLQDATLVNLGLNMMLFYDANDELVYSKFIDLNSHTPLEAGDEILSRLAVMKENQGFDQAGEFSGYLSTNLGPVIIASQPIALAEGVTEAKGRLMFGRIVDRSVIDHLSHDLSVPISLETPEPSILNGDTTSRVLDKNTIKGYEVIFDVQGKEAFVLGGLFARDAMKVARESIRSMMTYMGVSYFVLALLIFGILYRDILSRMIGLHHQVVEIGRRHDLSSRVELNPTLDEIHDLGDSINKLLSMNEKLYNEIDESRYHLEKKVERRTKELIVSNEKLKNEIDERNRVQQEIQHLAYHDSLTKLPNRLMFTERLENSLYLSRREDSLVAVVFIDLDEFKVVNDTLGHTQGDELLKLVAGRLETSLKNNDTVRERDLDLLCRIGGDEFVILLQGYRNQYNLNKISEEIRRCFDEPFHLIADDFYVSCSMGIAQYPADGEDVEELVKNADIAMYEAKAMGKNRYVICSDALKANVVETLSITNSMHHAIERNEMKVYYQPQVHSQSNRIIGLEALLRWESPTLGRISPSRFIPIAEKTRLILNIGEWVLREVCKQIVIWEEEEFEYGRISVNFSIHQLTSPKFVRTVSEILEETGVRPEKLEVEITESVAMDKTGVVIKVLKQLKDLGLAISIDDFGTEYSSLSRLKELTIDRIKIDLSFVQGIGQNAKDESIIKAIILLAENLGLSTIAEGVETREQLDFLNLHNCIEMQGYYYHKPMSATDMERLLRKMKNNEKVILYDFETVI